MPDTTAYILIKTVPHATIEVYDALSKTIHVTLVDIITGPYDLIAILEGDSPFEVLEDIMIGLRQINGVQDTITCFRVPREAHYGKSNQHS